MLVSGGILGEVWRAAELLEGNGIKARIIGLHTLKPLDQETILQACEETGAVITVEEHTIYGGLGGAVAEILLDNDARPDAFLRIGFDAGFSSIVGSQQYLREQYGLDAESINKRVQSLLCDKNNLSAKRHNL